MCITCEYSCGATDFVHITCSNDWRDNTLVITHLSNCRHEAVVMFYGSVMFELIATCIEFDSIPARAIDIAILLLLYRLCKFAVFNAHCYG